MPTLAVARNQFTVICALRLSRPASKICPLWGFSRIMCWSSSNTPTCIALAIFRVGKSRGKGKVRALPVHTMRAYRGSTGMALPIFNHGTSRWVISLMPRLFYPHPQRTPAPTEKEAACPPAQLLTGFESLTVHPKTQSWLRVPVSQQQRRGGGCGVWCYTMEKGWRR